jgi:hypothetical protein
MMNNTIHSQVIVKFANIMLFELIEHVKSETDICDVWLEVNGESWDVVGRLISDAFHVNGVAGLAGLLPIIGKPSQSPTKAKAALDQLREVIEGGSPSLKEVLKFLMIERR